MQSYQGTVGVVQAQTVYTLELATMGRNDVASKEYMDFKRARQAFEDAVRMVEQAGKWPHVTRIELFNDVSGSLMRWRRTVSVKAPALASPVEVQRVTELAKILPACKTPEGTIEWLKDEACKQYALRVAAVERCDELQAEVEQWKLAHRLAMQDNIKLQSELTKARELLEHMLKDDDMPVHWFAQRIDDFLSNQSAPADKDVQP